MGRSVLRRPVGGLTPPARSFDVHYDGAGNWPFNTAYAGGRGLDAFVTQLRGLNEAEQFIRAGIPLVASVAANPNKLTGFLLDKGTNGHLLVIVGFTASGNVVVNDPAATQQRDACSASTTGPSSSGPGCPHPAGSST